MPRDSDGEQYNDPVWFEETSTFTTEIWGSLRAATNALNDNAGMAISSLSSRARMWTATEVRTRDALERIREFRVNCSDSARQWLSAAEVYERPKRVARKIVNQRFIDFERKVKAYADR